MKVTFTARLTEVDRRRLLFEVEAHDEVEKVGEGATSATTSTLRNSSRRPRKRRARGSEERRSPE
ncbi:hypothetical protein MYX64_03950 [Nitrospinae bacterium AH_259_B05_G02_I21]|nr:hypothetical protein [Nitrospinae bacterium AH_259_B05_G02_I21]